ncbi:MAG: M13-type metalloendopeptidase [Candidatus Nanopelagicales bacterium]
MHSGIDPQHRDAGIRAQDDLFGHLNGRWLTEHEIPADRSADGVFHALRDASELHVRAIIEQAAAESEPGTVGAKVGDLYASFMDEAAVQSRGRAPIAADLDELRSLTDLRGLLEVMARLQLQGAAGGFLAPYVYTDAQASDEYVVYLTQAGLGLPDESYYRQDSFAAIRAAYRTHIARMLTLAGWSPDTQSATSSAAAIMALETAIAAQHWDNVAARDALKSYNRRTLAQMPTFVAGFGPREWLAALGAPAEHVAEVVVRQPSYVQALPGLLAEHPLAAWRDWLAWSVVRRSAGLLDDEMVRANFDFYGTTLTGAPQLRERWKRGVGLVEGALGEAVGELYVGRHFPPAAKARMVELVDNLVAAYRVRLETLEWMSPDTRVRALAKLAAFTPKIGYPDTWRSFDALDISADDLVGNTRRAALFEARYEWSKLGGPVDRLEWFMTPQTVNAYYNPGMNEIVFPAAILQPPFFDLDADDAVNYGAIGAVIGHEIGHGFDDQGSRYDGAGNLVDWWTEPDRARFEALAAALIAQFDGLRPRGLSDGAVSGALTVGENIGDLGGVTVALEAYRISLAGRPAPVLDGLTGDQRFFLGWAQAWRAKYRDAEALRLLSIDPHAPAEFRCNIVNNLAEFHEAFEVAPGDGMWRDPADRVAIW